MHQGARLLTLREVLGACGREPNEILRPGAAGMRVGARSGCMCPLPAGQVGGTAKLRAQWEHCATAAGSLRECKQGWLAGWARAAECKSSGQGEEV
jgi:hypothetical protein